MADYADIFESAGDLTTWLKSLPREQAAALTGVWIGAQGQARLTLGDKRAALMDIAKLFGWIVEKRENKIVDEFDSMTTEQIEAWLDERAEARVRVRHRLHGPQRSATGVAGFRSLRKIPDQPSKSAVPALQDGRAQRGP